MLHIDAEERIFSMDYSAVTQKCVEPPVHPGTPRVFCVLLLSSPHLSGSRLFSCYLSFRPIACISFATLGPQQRNICPSLHGSVPEGLRSLCRSFCSCRAGLQSALSPGWTFAAEVDVAVRKAMSAPVIDTPTPKLAGASSPGGVLSGFEEGSGGLPRVSQLCMGGFLGAVLCCLHRALSSRFRGAGWSGW